MEKIKELNMDLLSVDKVVYIQVPRLKAYYNCLLELKNLGFYWTDGDAIKPNDPFYYYLNNSRTMFEVDSKGKTISVHDVNELVNKDDLTYRYMNKGEVEDEA